MKKSIQIAVFIISIFGLIVNANASEKKVYRHFNSPVKKEAQGVRIDFIQLQSYFQKQHLLFAMMDEQKQNNVTLSLHATRKLWITDPKTNKNVGYIKIRYSQSKLRVYCSIAQSHAAVCNNLYVDHIQFLDSHSTDAVVEVAALEIKAH